MQLTPSQLEQVRLSILRYTLSPVSAALITAYLRAEGLRVDSDQVTQETQYLVDKGLLTTESKTISPEVARYRITADGRDYLALQGQS